MYSQPCFYPGDYHAVYNNAGQQGGWSSDSHIATQTPEPYRPSNQGTPQVQEDPVAPIDDYSPAYNDHHPAYNGIDATQGHSHLSSAYDPNVYSAGAVLLDNYFQGYAVGDPRVNGPSLPLASPIPPNFPLPLQYDSREKVPQLRYRCGNTQKGLELKQSISFSTSGRPGVKLLNVLNGKFEGLDGRDDPPFESSCRGITIRIQFPGYPPSTDVEKKLKVFAEKGERPKARSMQLSTKDYKNPPGSVTKSKLAQEVSKRIKWHIVDLIANFDLFPFDYQYDEKWRLGQGKMNFENMVVTELENVSSGSWSPVIYIE